WNGRARRAHRGRRGTDPGRHRAHRRGRRRRQHDLGDALRRVAPVVTDDSRTGLLSRLARADVLAGGGPAQFAGAPQTASYHPLAVDGPARRRTDPRVRHAGRGPAGSVATVLLVGPHRGWVESAGGDRRARVAHDGVSEFVLSACVAAEGAGGGVTAG